MIGIIGALDVELEFLFSKFRLKKTVKIADKTIYSGKIFNEEAIIAKSGIGKVNAALTTTLICSLYKPDYIINIGVAGGLDKTKIGDIILANGIAYFDVSLTDIDEIPFGKMGEDPLLLETDRQLFAKAKRIFLKQNIPFHVGNVVSGDRFVINKSALSDISGEVDDIQACEMEGMAVAMVCHKFNIPFLSIRGISDVLDDSDQGEKFRVSVRDVAKNTTKFVLAFLEEQNE